MDWPLPVARAYANFARSGDVKERHDRGFAVFEVLLKYLAAIFIADYVRGRERDHRVNAALKGLARPSLGEWVGFLRELLRFARETAEQRPGFCRALSEALLSKGSKEGLLELRGALTELMEKRKSKPTSLSLMSMLEVLVRYRNWGSGHGAPLSYEIYEQLAAKFSTAVEAFLESLGPLSRLRLLIVANAADGSAFPVMGMKSPKEAPLITAAGLGAAGQEAPELVPGRLYVQGDNVFCDCHPLLIFENDDVYFLNSGLDEKRLRVEYLSYSTGDHLLPRDLEDDQRRLLGVILGYDVSKEEFTRIVTSLTGETRHPVTGDAAGVLGDYTLVRELGRGGMGIVYEAFQRTLGRRVAVKTLLPSADARTLARFEREARAAAKLHHPNIVPVYEVGEAAGSHFFSMELIEGPNLAEVTAGERARRESLGEKKRSRGSWDVAAWVGRMRDAARALHYAHEAGMVHRDVKPQNFLLDPAGRLMLLDFGLVKEESEVTLTLSEERLGTLRYMSPEQLAKRPVDRRTDVWSLGATLYEILTLRPAFNGSTELEIERAITSSDPIAPRKLNRNLSRDLETIVLMALEKEPARRYQTAAELADDLDRFLRFEPIRARPPGLLRRAWKAMLRHKALSAAGLVAVALLLTFGGASWYRRHAMLQESLASIDRAIVSADAGTATKMLTYLRQEYGRPPAVEARAGLLSRTLRADGLREWKIYEELKETLDALKAEWERLEQSYKTWQPPWEREDELEAWERFQRAKEGIEPRYSQAVSLFSKAQELAPEGSAEIHAAKELLERAYIERHRRSLTEGSVALEPGFFKKLIESLGLGTFAAELEGTGRVAFETEPAGAEVFCFRYEPYEGRLLPLPFDPRAGRNNAAAGLVGQPFLDVEKVWDGRLSPFQPADRFLEVRGQSVRLCGDLAKALEKVKGDESVEVKVLRSGREEVLSWVPFPAASYGDGGAFPWSPGRVVTIRGQFGFTFAGCPLEFHPSARIGVTEAGAPVEVEVPQGSYLFVLLKDGYVDARFPVAAPRQPSVERVRLFQKSEVPTGFAYVPAGSFSYGGDEEAYESFPRGMASVPAFFIGRFEVTVKEWLEFLNDPEVSARLKPSSDKRLESLGAVFAQTVVDWNVEELRAIKPRRNEVRLVPSYYGKPVCVKDPSGPWNENNRAGVKLDWPVAGISMFSALEYVNWLNQRSDKRWRYCLPTEIEWEKAARGADRRTFVWGNYLLWCFCRSEPGGYGDSRVDSVGACPEDESVFGVHDMAGSLREVALGQRIKRARYAPLRGGDWNSSDPQHFHIANLNGQLPEESSSGSGLRLVAVPLSGEASK